MRLVAPFGGEEVIVVEKVLQIFDWGVANHERLL
jgi:hypothetical protein